MPPSSYPLRNDLSGPVCLHCGMVLPRGLYCTNCGYYNSPAQTNISAQETQPSPSVTPFLGIAPDAFQIESRESSANAPSYPSSHETQPTLIIPVEVQKERPAQVSDTTQPTLIIPVGVQKERPAQVSDTTQPTLIIPVGVQKERPAQVSGPQKIARQKTRGRNILLGIMLSIIVLVGGGVAGYSFVYSSATQKSVRTITSQPSPRPQKSLKFTDTFKNNTNQWDLQSEAGKYSVAIMNGKLMLEDDNNSLLPEFLPGNRSFNNFKVTVDAMLSKGDTKNGYGLLIRCVSDQSGIPTTYYRFELYGDSTYAIFKGIVDAHGKASPSPLNLLGYTANTAIQKQGRNNHIEIDAHGPAMTIRVNGQVLKTFSDPSYTKGTIAFFLSNIQNALPVAQATFSNLTIYPL